MANPDLHITDLSNAAMPPPPSPRYVLSQQLQLNKTPRGNYFYDSSGGQSSSHSGGVHFQKAAGATESVSTASVRSESRASVYGSVSPSTVVPLTFIERVRRGGVNGFIQDNDLEGLRRYVYERSARAKHRRGSAKAN